MCYERNRSQVERKRCFTKDEGRPLEVGLQEQASNGLKLRRSRALVVSVDGKGGAGLRQVRIEKLPARAVAGWASHPLESAAFSRRTPNDGSSICRHRRKVDREPSALLRTMPRSLTGRCVSNALDHRRRQDGVHVESVEGARQMGLPAWREARLHAARESHRPVHWT